MNQVDQSTSGLSTILRVLRRRVAIVVVCALVVPASALAFSLSQEKQYSASASLLFRDPQLDQTLFGSTFLAPSNDPDREAATNVKLVSLDVVAERTERLLPKVGSVSENVEVVAEGQSDVVSIMATDPDPEAAADIANTFAAEYIAFRREADRAKIRDAQELVNRQLDELPQDEVAGQRGRSLLERSEQLQVLVSLQTGNAELVERATAPSSASSPKVARDTAIGAVLGLILGGALALLLERLDRRLRDPKEIEEMFDRPILGAIPESRLLARSGPTQATLQPQEGEAFRMLRANLRYFDIDREVDSVLVTSAAPGDGKTTVAWNLASAAAGAGGKVLLIEADLRHPGLANSLGLRGSAGLSTVLAGEATLEATIQEIPVQEQANGRGLRTVDVLLAGPLPPNPSDLLESDRMRELIADGERTHDLLVIDTPPTSVVSDAIPLIKQVGGVIVVARLAKTTREAALHLHNQLKNLDARVFGIVVNAVGSDAGNYGYSYGYGYGDGDRPKKADSKSEVGVSGSPG